MTLRDVIEKFLATQNIAWVNDAAWQFVSDLTQAIEREGIWVPKEQFTYQFAAQKVAEKKHTLMRMLFGEMWDETNCPTVFWHDWSKM